MIVTWVNWLCYTGNTFGGSGAGHGGSGGRGSSLQAVGTGYDSLYNPTKHGSAGGYGHNYGMDASNSYSFCWYNKLVLEHNIIC